MLSIICRPALPCYVSCDVWCVWCGICAMLMTVITDLIRVIRNQLRCPLSISARPLFTQQQLEEACWQLSVIANIPEQITQWCQAQNSDGMTSHYPHDGWPLLQHQTTPCSTHETRARCYIIRTLCIFVSLTINQSCFVDILSCSEVILFCILMTTRYLLTKQVI